MDGVQKELGAVQNRLWVIEKKLDLLLRCMGITDLAAFGINDIPANGDEKREGFQSKSIPSEIAATLESLQPDQIEERKKEEEHEALFTYQPLDPLKSEIRILTLRYSPNFSDPLVADLVVGSLDGAQVHPNIWTYTALSYTWGPPVFDGSITLNGRLFPITKNLEIALRYMRKSNSDYSHASFRRLGDTAWWIDQICINQQDIEERSSQVSLMRRIYKRATSVSVWLGESSPDSSRAIDLLTAIGRPPINAPGEKKIVYPEFSAEDVCKNWRALKNLLERPWWERVWIRQEVALSNSVKLWVGERCCEMELLAPTLGVINYLQNMGIEVPVQDGVDDADDDKTVEGEIGGLKLPWDYHGQQLQSLRGMTSGGFAWVELENLLPAVRGCKATNPLDTVFSILGLCDPDQYPLIPDYHSSLPSTLLSATRTILTTTNPNSNAEDILDILSCCQNADRRHGLPSWVPNLLDDWKSMPFGTKEAKYDHRNRSLRVTNLEPDLSIEGECLLIRGGHIDQVSQLCDIPVPRSASVSELEEIYRSWRRFVQAKGSQLSIDEYDGYTDRRNEKEVSRLWTRFLTVHYDEAKDLETPYGEDPPSDDDKLFYDTDLLYDTDPPEPNLQPITLTTQALVDAERDLMFRTKSQINLRLSFCHLLPSSASLRLHPNHRIHAGLRLNGPGRRLCITKRGFIALVPANSVVGDSLAVLQGASFAYVLRKQDGGEEGNLLVGEAFVPRWAYGMGEDLAMEWGKGIDEVIRIY